MIRWIGSTRGLSLGSAAMRLNLGLIGIYLFRHWRTLTTRQGISRRPQRHSVSFCLFTRQFLHGGTHHCLYRHTDRYVDTAPTQVISPPPFVKTHHAPNTYWPNIRKHSNALWELLSKVCSGHLNVPSGPILICRLPAWTALFSHLSLPREPGPMLLSKTSQHLGLVSTTRNAATSVKTASITVWLLTMLQRHQMGPMQQANMMSPRFWKMPGPPQFHYHTMTELANPNTLLKG